MKVQLQSDCQQHREPTDSKRIAILIPCYNEELTIGNVVRQFRAELPNATIYVFDNNSTDRTTEEALAAGALIVREPRQGKGYVVQSMFQKVEADIYVMVDGDGTYAPSDVHDLLEPVLRQEAEMVVGTRLHLSSQSEFKKLNRFGNRLFLAVLNSMFHVQLTDVLSGYRVFTREFVKNIPLFASGFDIETELTIKALERGYPVREVPIDLSLRPEGSFSKIRYLKDGISIVHMILSLFRDYKPLTLFGTVGILMIISAFVLSFMLAHNSFSTMPPLPVAALAVGIALSGVLVIAVALVLHTTVRRFQELEYQIRTLANHIYSSVRSKYN